MAELSSINGAQYIAPLQSPLTADVHDTISGVKGFRVAGVHCGMKANNALDFALIASDTPCTAAGVFTTNHVKAAPVLLDMERLSANAGGMRAVAVNARCANACTGEQGMVNAREMARYAAERLGCDENAVFVMSTGVIGTQLPMHNICKGVDLAVPALGDDWDSTSRAIMTTDTRPKRAAITVTTDSGASYSIAGISKGAGMIAPNMATMLGVIVTDAGLSPQAANAALKNAADLTYNRIVVDGDMSTNDTVLLLANGASGVMLDSEADLAGFQAALLAVSRKLAQDIVRDGEGVTKFITLHVSGAGSDADAKAIANTIATSPLVKTAFFGNDANWGRIIAAAGRAGVPFNPDAALLTMASGELDTPDGADSVTLFRNGMPTAYAEADASRIISAASITLWLECGVGAGAATIWTCDLSHEYVSINGDYRS